MAGAARTAIIRQVGSAQFRVLHVATNGKLTLQGVTVQGGEAGGGVGNGGGGIFNNGGVVAIANSRLVGNLGFGAALDNNGGFVPSTTALSTTTTASVAHY